MLEYHDNEWGVPVHDDRKHFEHLILDGAQAGLSWRTILYRREGYRKAFHNFDAQEVEWVPADDSTTDERRRHYPQSFERLNPPSVTPKHF